jgi:hypothetical protein
VVAFASGLCEAYPKESRVRELKTASIVTIVLATMFLSLRLYSRWLKTRRLWSDDGYAIIAAVSPRWSIFSARTDLEGTPHYSIDHHPQNVPQGLRSPLLERTSDERRRASEAVLCMPNALRRSADLLKGRHPLAILTLISGLHQVVQMERTRYGRIHGK